MRTGETVISKQEYKRGKTVTELEIVELQRKQDPKRLSVDAKYLMKLSLISTLQRRMREMAFLNKGTKNFYRG